MIRCARNGEEKKRGCMICVDCPDQFGMGIPNGMKAEDYDTSEEIENDLR